MKERALAEPALLPGTPGTLIKREGSGAGYAYRTYYPVPGAKQKEDLIGRWDDAEKKREAMERIEFAFWMEAQLSSFRKLGFQVADKKTARILVELHNRGLFAAGLSLVGTLAYAVWLNELGIVTVAARTQDVDLARGRPLKLAAPLSFLEAMTATSLPFVPVPGMPSTEPSTSVKLPGAEGLRVDLLVSGRVLGKPVQVPEMTWSAQQIPFYNYLLEAPTQAVVLAGGHCIPVCVPQVGRFVCHKLYSAANRGASREKAEKDLQQAKLLLAALAESDPPERAAAFAALPTKMRISVLDSIRKIQPALAAYPEAEDFLKALSPLPDRQ